MATSYATTYSASRLGTFESCRLKYHLQYKYGYYAEEKQQNILTRKGSAFHELAENYNPMDSPDQLLAFRLAIEKKYVLPEEFSLERPLIRFQKFFDEVIASCSLQGGQVQREVEFKFDLKGSNFTGKLDVLLSYPDGTFMILDYKTGKSANTSYYTGQMMLYTWALMQEHKIPIEEAANRIQVGLFFPMAQPDDEGYGKVFKKIKFTKDHIEKETREYLDLINSIENTPWQPEANINKLCEFCAFVGQKEFCPMSVRAGLIRVRGVEVKQKDWAIKAGVKYTPTN